MELWLWKLMISLNQNQELPLVKFTRRSLVHSGGLAELISLVFTGILREWLCGSFAHRPSGRAESFTHCIWTTARAAFDFGGCQWRRFTETV